MDLESLGHAAGIYQQNPRAIREAIHAVQIKEAARTGESSPIEAQAELILNGVAYFGVDEIIAAIAHMAEEEARRVRSEAAARARAAAAKAREGSTNG